MRKLWENYDNDNDDDEDNDNHSKHKTSKVVAEEEPGLGDEKINYQEYVVPAFLTQVGHQHNQIGADRGGDGGADYEDQDREGIVLIHWRFHSLQREANWLKHQKCVLISKWNAGDLFSGDGAYKRIFHCRTSTGTELHIG